MAGFGPIMPFQTASPPPMSGYGVTGNGGYQPEVFERWAQWWISGGVGPQPTTDTNVQMLQAAQQRIYTLTNLLNSPRPATPPPNAIDGGTGGPEHETEQQYRERLAAELRSLQVIYDDAGKKARAVDTALGPALANRPILLPGGGSTGYYIDPVDPTKTLHIGSTPDEIAARQATWDNSQASRDATAREGAANRAQQNTDSLRTQQNNINSVAAQRENTAARLTIAKYQDAHATLAALEDEMKNGVTITTDRVNAARTQATNAKDIMDTAINQLTAVGLAETRAWTDSVGIAKDIQNNLNTTMASRARDLSNEDRTAFTGAYTQRNETVKAIMEGVTAAKALYLDSLKQTTWASPEWWDAYQKGMMALSAGKRVPPDIMKQLITTPGPHTGNVDPDWVQKTVGSLSSAINQAAPPVTFQRSPQLPLPTPYEPPSGPGQRPDLGPLHDTLEQYFQYGQDKDQSGLGYLAGTGAGPNEHPVPEGPLATAAGGAPPPGFPTVNAAPPIEESAPPSEDSNLLGGEGDLTTPSPSPLEETPPEDQTQGSFTSPDSVLDPKTIDAVFLNPFLSAGMPNELMPNAATALMAVVHGYEPEQATNEAFDGTGQQWDLNMDDYDKQLRAMQDQMFGNEEPST